MTGLADRLQIFIGFDLLLAPPHCPGCSLIHHVIYMSRWPVAPVAQARLTKAFVAREDALARDLPILAVPSLVPAAAILISELADCSVGLMGCAVA